MTLDHILNQPVIQVETCVLRPLRRSDMGLIEHYGGDPRVANMTTSIPHPYPPGAAEAFVTRAMSHDREEDIWAIDGLGGAELKGVMSLTKMDRDQSEVGYWTAPIFWNSGVASDALQALIDANPQGNKTMFASVFQDNLASARVLTHCGFEYLGDAESFSVARGATVPTFTYSRKL
ncbi:GNAT family N-acetyltransferase [Falsiphaeobacter marinintestinus]|uniref:GNAT family N-acetyltransferase n=1 Tax=Falsiphaeobacter marinintestinus TaxID=1492905 RepID=UPI0011B7EA56|nr:GNAT family N-acetyltransferase [Phaeobacter marinintestinus]